MNHPMGLHVQQRDRLLLVGFETPQRVASWAIHNGGLREASQVAWVGVRNRELPIGVDPLALLQARLSSAGVPHAVGMLTSRDLERHVVHHVEAGGHRATCVATVGLSNALRAGDPPGPAPSAGTINLVCWTSIPLSASASLEALCLTAEARTLALCEASVESRQSGRRATGTGTDCCVIASPVDASREPPYAGKHTLAGHLVGAAVHAAITRGTAAWLAERTRAADR